jgi:uncharacterized protein YdeI (YjbR/CyaY-like superfamily)
MTKEKVAGGLVHEVPEDLMQVLVSNQDLLDKWNNLTQIARNEWICWVTIVKRPKTRKEHIERLHTELIAGKRRPCCWAGCPHRMKNG